MVRASKRAQRRAKPTSLALRRQQLMKEKGIVQEDLAARWGTSQSFVSQVIGGKARSYERELDFAKLVGLPHGRLFPPPPKRRNDLDTLAAAAAG